MNNSRYMDTIGDGSGVKNAIGDYASTPTIFKIKPRPSEIFHVHRLIPFLQDSGSLDTASYGNGIILTAGIEIKVVDDSGVLWDITDGVPIKSNAAWKKLCFDENISEYGQGDESGSWRYTFDKDGDHIVLDGANGGELQASFGDSFAQLVEHYFRVGMIKIK